MATPHLPEEILLQIVQRLPLRSVLRWKRVSKQWKDLINDPLFYKSYKDNSNRTAFFGSLDSLYCVFINDVDDKATELIPGRNFNTPPITVHRLTIPLSNCNRYSSFDTPKFLGSSHGMACFKEEDGPFLLYNLFTGSLHTVANVPQNRCFKEEEEDLFRYYGFGYDGYGDDYKIFVYLNEYKPREGVWIYSFRNKDWKSFKGFPYETFTWHTEGRVAYSMNGVLHWCLFLMEDTFKGTEMGIITYDLHTNRFGEIQVPPKSADLYGVGDYYQGMTVAELNGQLCYVREKLFVSHGRLIFGSTNVWVMKEYGVGDSWERFATIYIDSRYTRSIIPTTLLYKCEGGGRLVLCNWDEQFVRHYEKALLWYNVDENKIQVDPVSKQMWHETVIGQEQQIGK